MERIAALEAGAAAAGPAARTEPPAVPAAVGPVAADDVWSPLPPRRGIGPAFVGGVDRLAEERIVEPGTHAELIARDSTYAELFGVQASAYAADRARDA